VALDYETLRRNRVNEQARDMSDWDKAAAEQVERDRAAYAQSREEEAHRRDLEAFQIFCQRKAAAAVGTEDESLWDRAAESIRAGEWPISRRLSADPEIMRFAGLRTRLNYAGSNRRLDD
jgi:hypothetical protein